MGTEQTKEFSLKSQKVLIVNQLGLHARAAAKLVQLTDQFNALVTIEKDLEVAQTDSIMDLMMLMASPGDHVLIKTTGPEADAALAAVVQLFADGFGEALATSYQNP